MGHLKILNSKERKEVLDRLKNDFGFENELPYVMLKSQKDKIYLINRDVEKIDLSRMKIDSLGMYFGEYAKDVLRLSIEGTQLIGEKCKRNVVELDEREMKQWLMGKDIEKFFQEKLSGFVILKCKNDFLGCGKYSEKDGKILNYIPKSRRILAE